MQRVWRQLANTFPSWAVALDSHLTLPMDERDLDSIRQKTCCPLKSYTGSLEGIMPAHVVYPNIDPNPAGFHLSDTTDIAPGIKLNGTVLVMI